MKPLYPLLLLVGGLVVLNLVLFRTRADSATGILGGPAPEVQAIEDGSLEDIPLIQVAPAANDENVAGFALVDKAAALNAENPASGTLGSRDGLMVYKVRKGDTLPKIAAHFGISANTIRWANSGLSSRLAVGQELVILPISGVAHRVSDGETVESIAALYSVSAQSILAANRTLAPGATIIVPGAKPVAAASLASVHLPDLGNYFMMPTKGWNWGRLHDHNAVDISNACGTPIYAAAEGLVESVGMSVGWNEGYGGFVKIKHPVGDSIETVYAHTSENLVKEGDYVSRGDLIAKIGNTGNVTGPTGCHVHFEIHGAKNPFAKY